MYAQNGLFFGTPPCGKIHEENPQGILYGKVPGKKFIREITKEFYMGKYMVKSLRGALGKGESIEY